MSPTEPLPLHHSWPLFERDQRFDLGLLLAEGARGLDAAALPPFDGDMLARQGIGRWECDLTDNALTWSAGVYDIFGLPRRAPVTRDEAVALYGDESRAAMERLRAYAIKHRRGFTLDVEIRPALTGRCWMRLIAAPLCDGDRVVRLHGLKRMIGPPR